MRRNFTPDETLIDSLFLNDTSAFEELFHRYCYFLYSYSLGKLNSPDDAKRIVRDIFISLWENRHKLPVDFSISIHLYTEVRKAIVQCLNEKLEDETNTGFIQKQIVPGFSVIELQKAKRPIRKKSTQVFLQNEKTKAGEFSWLRQPAVIDFKKVKYSLRSMLNLW